MTKEIEAAVAALSSDPALAGYLGPLATVLVWTPDGDRLLWASPAAESLRRILTDEGGQIRLAHPARPRLAALASGLAPKTGIRLERIRLELGGLLPPSTVICRLISVADRDVLLTVVLDPPAETISEEGGMVPDNSSSPPTDPVMAPFVERVRRLGTRRFIWSVDREGRFISVSQPLGEVVGIENAEIVGSSWSEILTRFVVDERNVIAECFARRATWSDEVVLWRVADTSYVVPVDLGGMPVYGRGHEFEGFRGFGLCRADEIQPAPDGPRHAEELAGATNVAKPDPLPAEPPIQDGVVTETKTSRDDTEGRVEAVAFGGLQARVGAHLGGGRPVPLRVSPEVEPSMSEAVQGRVGSPAPDPGRLEGDRKPILSVAERGALREIARALGARFEGDELRDTSEPKASGEVVPMPVARLREPEASRVLDRLPAGIVVLRGETPLFANRFLLDLLGYADIAELGAKRGVTRLFSGRLGPRGRGPGGPSPLTLVARTGANLPVEVKLTTVDWGDAPASLLLIRPLSDEAPQHLARSLEVEMAARDAALRELAGTLDLAGLGTASVDEAGRILSMNGRAERLFGYHENEIAGEALTLLIAPESHFVALDLLRGAWREGAAEDGRAEVFGRTRDGQPVPLLVRAGRSRNDRQPAVTMTFEDISELKRNEAELNAARRAAETASARQTEFLARVSHEIRTPLNAIIGFAEIMLEERFGPVGSDRYKLYLRDIHSSGGHVVSLINDLLDLAKVTSGRSQLLFTKLDLNQVLGDTVSLMGAEAGRARILMRSSFRQDLPPVVADERSLRQVALNLLANAVRYTGIGGQVIVSTGLTDRGDVTFRIRDTGLGMSPDEIEAALEPFRQVSVARRGEGTGLGLPLSKALVEANRAFFTLTSARGEGTLVEVRFPVSRVLGE